MQTAPRSEVRALRAGVTIETVAQRDRKAKPLVAKTKPCEVRAPNAKAPRLLEFALTEGRNRQIRKMCAAPRRHACARVCL